MKFLIPTKLGVPMIGQSNIVITAERKSGPAVKAMNPSIHGEINK